MQLILLSCNLVTAANLQIQLAVEGEMQTGW